MTSLAVGVVGAGGRMGSATCAAIEGDAELELVARLGRGDDLDALVATGAQVAVDFTTPAAVLDNVAGCLERGVHVVVGTTGLSAQDLERIEGWTKPGAHAIVAPNFAIGAALMMSFAAQAAPHFERAEVVERHHERKLDAPSGTALRTADLMNEARATRWAGAGDEERLAGSRGGDADGIRIHSLRLPGSIAHQEVVLGGPGETLTIRHDSIDRSSFMPGVLLAIKSVASRPGLTVGLERLLELPG
jgi:4-hydroxy-tetrahydrodipicolinate reductase